MVKDRLLIVVILVALIVKGVYYAQFLASPLFEYNIGDQIYYHEWAERIAGGDWLGKDVFEQGPLYAYGLGIMYSQGLNTAWILAIQMSMGIATSVLVYFCGCRLFNRHTGFVAALLAAVYGPFAYYECMVMKSFLSPLLTMVSLYAALRFSDHGRLRWLMLSGAAIGVACLNRESHILLLVPLAFSLWEYGKSKDLNVAAQFRQAAILVASVLLMVIPVTIRNFHVASEFVVVTAGGGEVMYIAHGPEANGYWRPPPFGRPTVGLEHQDFRDEAERRTGKKLTHGQSSRYWMNQALYHVASDPLRSAQLTIKKTVILLNDNERPDSAAYPLVKEFVPVLYWLPSLGWIVGLGIIGIPFRQLKKHLLPLGFVIAFILSILLTYNFGRFRIGMMPVWMLFTANGLVWLLGTSWREQLRLKVGAIILALAVSFSAFLSPPPPPYPADSAAETQRWRDRLKERQTFQSQVVELRRIIAADAINPKAHASLGHTLFELGKDKEAFQSYEEAIRIDDQNIEWRIRYATDLKDLGYEQRAIDQLRQILKIDPEIREIDVALGKLLRRQGKPDEADAHFRRAAELDDLKPQ